MTSRRIHSHDEYGNTGIQTQMYLVYGGFRAFQCFVLATGESAAAIVVGKRTFIEESEALASVQSHIRTVEQCDAIRVFRIAYVFEVETQIVVNV